MNAIGAFELQRLAEWELELPAPAAALGNYEPWCIVGNLFMTSGQFPFQDGQLPYRGQLGREVDLAQAYAACRLAALNALAQLHQATQKQFDVRRIYRLEGVLNVAEGYVDHPKALDGASDLIHHVFGRRGQHTRMIWTNPVLPLNSVCLVYLFAELAPVGASSARADS